VPRVGKQRPVILLKGHRCEHGLADHGRAAGDGNRENPAAET